MATVPSIKGSIFSRSVEDLRKLLSEDRLSRDELEARLEKDDLAYLDEPVRVSSWYDVAAYGRILELLKAVVGGGRDDYLRARGAQSAQALLEGGLYQQMEYLERTGVAAAKGPEDRFRAFGRDLALLSSLHRAILNFGTQTAKLDPEHPDRYVLEITEADPYPDGLVLTTEGFVNRMAVQHDHPDLWVSSRPRRDLIVMRMTRTV